MNAIRSQTPGQHRSSRSALGRLTPVLLGLILVLSGCSVGGGRGETPTPTAAPGAGRDGAVSGPRLVGELADQINTAWLSVRSYRVTTVQGSGDLAAIPTPSAPVSAAAPPDPNATWQAVVDEIVLPDQRHYLESNGGSISEFTAVQGRVYARGRFSQLAIRPDLDATTWVNLDPAFISADSTIGQFLTAFMGGDAAAFRSPLSDLQPDTREQELTAIGAIEAGGRSCSAYQWVDTSETGDQMTRIVSIDASGLPCSLEFLAGDYTSRATWDSFNLVPPIVAPVESVTVTETLDMGTSAGTPVPAIDGAEVMPVNVPDFEATPSTVGTPPGVAAPESIAPRSTDRQRFWAFSGSEWGAIHLP